MSSFCSVFCLCVAAVSCVVSAAMMGIAVSTDNWQQVSVNRPLLNRLAHSINNTQLKVLLRSNINFYDRVKGLFRICFPYDEKPRKNWRDFFLGEEVEFSNDQMQLYLNPVDEWCTNIDYYIDTFKIGELVPKSLSDEGQIWLHFTRTSLACFCLYFIFFSMAALSGLRGCWKVSGSHLLSTSTLLLMTSLWGVAGMGFWHGAYFYELNRVHDSELGFFLTWPQILRENTVYKIGWSYVIAWVSVGCSIISCFAFTGAKLSIRQDLKNYKKQQVLMKLQYCYPAQFYPQLHYGSYNNLPGLSLQPGALSPSYCSVNCLQNDPRMNLEIYNQKDLVDANL